MLCVSNRTSDRTRTRCSGRHPTCAAGSPASPGRGWGVAQLLGYLREGHTIEDFLNDFPTVTRDQAQRAIERIDNEYIKGMEPEAPRTAG